MSNNAHDDDDTNTKPPPEFRGIFGDKGDSSEWLAATAQFPNGVPRFESKEECQKFTLDYVLSHGGSNPDFPYLTQSCTTLITWDQISKHLLPAVEGARKEPSKSPKVPNDYGRTPDDNSRNIYEQSATRDVVDAINSRLDLPIHQCSSPVSVTNTLKYLFFHMKCGIYVMIRDGKLRIFSAFANRDYRNTWHGQLKLKNGMSIEEYYAEKRSSGMREENIETDMSTWWANGNIICNELSSDKKKTIDEIQVWGDQFLMQMRDMLAEACRTRDIPDCEFFLNKRDYPQLKVNVQRGVPVEPYGFIFDKDDRDPDQDVELGRHKYNTYAPIVSFYAAAPDRFSDLPGPSSEDWEGACGLVFPKTLQYEKPDASDIPSPRDLFTENNFRKFERDWEDNREATAFFRGTATGGGTTIENNQRIKAASLSHQWKDDPIKGGEEPYLDAHIVGWNKRDKKEWDTPMTYLNPDTLGFKGGKQFFTPIYEQSKYKYLLYIDGHCAACRYGFMMRLGSVILKVEARQVADRMWYFPLLEPYVDHVPVKSDLSDLAEKIKWCRDHDDECRQIAKNCLEKYEKYVARSGLLDYIEMMTKCIARHQINAPSWWEAPPPMEQPPPKLEPPPTMCFRDRLCARCQEDADREQQEKEEAEAMAAQNQKSKAEQKKSRRERMIRQAQEKQKELAKKQKIGDK